MNMSSKTWWSLTSQVLNLLIFLWKNQNSLFLSHQCDLQSRSLKSTPTSIYSSIVSIFFSSSSPPSLPLSFSAFIFLSLPLKAQCNWNWRSPQPNIFLGKNSLKLQRKRPRQMNQKGFISPSHTPLTSLHNFVCVKYHSSMTVKWL